MNSRAGAEAERAGLRRLGFRDASTINRQLFDEKTYRSIDGTEIRAFIPEHTPKKVAGEWRFVEVKNSPSSPIHAGGTSNTANMIRFLEAQGGGRLDLVLVNGTRITTSLERLINRTRRKGVTVRITEMSL